MSPESLLRRCAVLACFVSAVYGGTAERLAEARLVYGDLLVGALQILPPLFSQLFTLAPISTMQGVKDAGTTADLPLLPYSMMVCNGFLWMCYGWLAGDTYATPSTYKLFFSLLLFSPSTPFRMNSMIHLPSTSLTHFFCTFHTLLHRAYYLRLTRQLCYSLPTYLIAPLSLYRSVIGANVSALLLGVYYCNVFIANKAPDTDVTTPLVVSGGAALLVVAMLFLEQEAAVNAVGTLGCVVVVVMVGGPLTMLAQVIALKSTASIPFPSAVMTTGCCLVWFLYGLLVNDIYVYGPNVIGLLSGMAQLCLFAVYGFAKVKPN